MGADGTPNFNSLLDLTFWPPPTGVHLILPLYIQYLSVSRGNRDASVPAAWQKPAVSKMKSSPIEQHILVFILLSYSST